MPHERVILCNKTVQTHYHLTLYINQCLSRPVTHSLRRFHFFAVPLLTRSVTPPSVRVERDSRAKYTNYSSASRHSSLVSASRTAQDRREDKQVRRRPWPLSLQCPVSFDSVFPIGSDLVELLEVSPIQLTLSNESVISL